MPFQIAVVQFHPKRGNVQANISQVQSLLNGIQADLVVLPELANSGYLYESTRALLPHAEPQHAPGGFLSALSGLAAEMGSVIVTGYAEKQGERVFNSAAAISADGLLANYRKIHLYADEKALFVPGDQGFTVFEWQGVRIGMMICFDWIFPESARTLALKGAQIIAHPANLVMPYCQDAMLTRAIENRVFTVTANRIGAESLGLKSLTFTGVSQVTSPLGEVLFRGPKNETAVHTLSIDPAEAQDKQISLRNDLFADRRTQFYDI